MRTSIPDTTLELTSPHGREDTALVARIGQVFDEMFSKVVLLDIMFVDTAMEQRVAAVCPPSTHGDGRNRTMANALNVIYPYMYEGMWVFDDERAGLDKEPFVEGADTIIDSALAMKGIVNGDKGFRLIFSAGPFPNYDVKFEWVREGDGGNWYRAPLFQMEGWLCPALLKYFDEAPKEIYARFEEKPA